MYDLLNKGQSERDSLINYRRPKRVRVENWSNWIAMLLSLFFFIALPDLPIPFNVSKHVTT